MGAKHPPSYPNEMLVKLCSSKSYSNLTNNIFKKKINVCEVDAYQVIIDFLDKNGILMVLKLIINLFN